MLAGCSGSQPPIGAPGATARAAIVTHADRGKSWMLARAKNDDLLYVGDGFYPFTVSVYNYKTDKLVGQLSGSFYEASGMCVDKKSDIWITSDYTSQVIEYAHGGTNALQTLSTDGTPIGCSVSPDGDLAVTNHSTKSGAGLIQIWKNASGNPKTTLTRVRATSCGPLDTTTRGTFTSSPRVTSASFPLVAVRWVQSHLIGPSTGQAASCGTVSTSPLRTRGMKTASAPESIALCEPPMAACELSALPF
jgi:hypothetical protein